MRSRSKEMVDSSRIREWVKPTADGNVRYIMNINRFVCVCRQHNQYALMIVVICYDWPIKSLDNEMKSKTDRQIKHRICFAKLIANDHRLNPQKKFHDSERALAHIMTKDFPQEFHTDLNWWIEYIKLFFLLFIDFNCDLSFDCSSIQMQEAV